MPWPESRNVGIGAQHDISRNLHCICPRWGGAYTVVFAMYASPMLNVHIPPADVCATQSGGERPFALTRNL
jgi:hypothetical protein